MSGLSMSRRGLLTGASALGATAALSACGAKTGGDTSSAAGAQADTSGDTVKVGLLNSLSGTMAISEVTVHNALLLAVKEINAAAWCPGQEAEAHQPGRRLRLADLRREGGGPDHRRQGGRHLRLLDLRQPQGRQAGLRALQVAPVLSRAVRGPGAVPVHLLHRRHHQPADRPGPRLPQEAGPDAAVPGGQRLRLPAHRQQDHQGVRGGPGHEGGRGGLRAARLHRVQHDRQQGQGQPARTRCSTRSTATATWRSSRSTSPPG